VTLLPALFLPLYLASAAAPGALEASLRAAREEARLPVAFALAVAPRLALSFHHREDWNMAFLLPATGSTPPRLLLHAPYYRRGWRLAAASELPLDAAEYLFHSLALAWLELEVLGSGSALEATLRRRAEGVLPEVPEEHRLEAYLDAGASFASHALAVAAQLERLHAERRQRGAWLCPAAGQGWPLFGVWERIFTSEPYAGSFVAPASGGAVAGPRRHSRSVLQRQDKQLFARELLSGLWTGDPLRDFAAFCPPP
jgi:hypothetical protein